MKKAFIFLKLVALNFFLIGLLHPSVFPSNGAYRYRPPDRPHGVDIQATPVIGAPQAYITQKGDSLLDIARYFDLGFSEIQLPYRNLDPWVLPEGLELTIPTFWVLPEGKWNGMLINIPEMRLYFFLKKHILS